MTIKELETTLAKALKSGQFTGDEPVVMCYDSHTNVDFPLVKDKVAFAVLDPQRSELCLKPKGSMSKQSIDVCTDAEYVYAQTPVGLITARTSLDCDFPGVRVELKGSSVNSTFAKDAMDICWVEYAVEKDELRIVVYGDGNDEEPTDTIVIRNYKKSDMLE